MTFALTVVDFFSRPAALAISVSEIPNSRSLTALSITPAALPR